MVRRRRFHQMTYTREQLINALVNEYEYLCHDDFDPDVDLTTEEYRLKIECYNDEDLINETAVDENFTIQQFMETWG
jgi:hypothetical protein